MDWIAYGTNGPPETDWDFTSEQGGPGGVPPFGVLVISQPDPVVGRVLNWNSEKGYFVFVHEHGEWDCKDFAGMIDALAHFPGCVVRFGRGVPNIAFDRIMRRAVEDPRLPPKSGWKAGEERPRGV